MFDLIEFQTNFWTGILLVAALLLALVGVFYAATLAGTVVWVLIVAILALIVWVVGKRFAGWLIDGNLFGGDS